MSLNSDLVTKGFAAEVKGRLSPEGGEECDGSESVRRNVRFRWCGADSVSVAGSFSEWKQLTLKRGYLHITHTSHMRAYYFNSLTINVHFARSYFTLLGIGIMSCMV